MLIFVAPWNCGMDCGTGVSVVQPWALRKTLFPMKRGNVRLCGREKPQLYKQATIPYSGHLEIARIPITPRPMMMVALRVARALPSFFPQRNAAGKGNVPPHHPSLFTRQLDHPPLLSVPVLFKMSFAAPSLSFKAVLPVRIITTSRYCQQRRICSSAQIRRPSTCHWNRPQRRSQTRVSFWL